MLPFIQAFAGSVHDTIPVVCQLLCSKQTSDILEAIEFFVTAFEFEVSGAINGVKRMLSLVWSSEADVKKAVVDAYKRLYMNLEVDSSSKKKAIGVVTNLTSLISCSTQGELASLEELVSLCVKSGDLPKLCIQVILKILIYFSLLMYFQCNIKWYNTIAGYVGTIFHDSSGNH